MAAKRQRCNVEKSEQLKYYRTQSAAEKAGERAHKKYYSVTVWRVDDRTWAVHSKELKPKDLRQNASFSKKAAKKYFKAGYKRKLSKSALQGWQRMMQAHPTVYPKKATYRNPTVYDSAGKAIGKFSRKAAKIAARVVGGRVGPTISFPTKAALLKYAHEHGLKVASLRKVHS